MLIITESLTFQIDFKKFRKLIIILLVTLLVLSNNFLFPMKKAEAFVWAGALPAGITVGGGAYALGALAIGSVAVGLGIEHGDTIKKHAANVWNSTTDLAKSSLEASMQYVVDSGQNLQKVGAGFWDWVTGKSEQIAAAVVMGGVAVHNLVSSKDRAEEVTRDSKVIDGDQVVEEPLVLKTAFPYVALNITAASHPRVSSPGRPSEWYFKGTYRATFTFPENSTDSFAFTSNETGLLQFRKLSIDFADGTLKLRGSLFADDLGTNKFYGTLAYLTELTVSTLGLASNPLADMDYTQSTAVFTKLINARTVEDILGLVGTLGLDNIGIGGAETWESYNQTRLRLLEQSIPTMRDAGLVLPVNDIIPTTADGQTLTYNPDAGVYTYPDGAVYQGDVSWTYPDVIIKEVDGTPTIIVNVEGVPTDVITGNPVSTGTPPSGGGGGGDPPSKFDLTPLVLLGDKIKSKFPFSIPWDVYNLFNQLNVEPITPVFKIDHGDVITLGGKNININYDFDIDFSIFDPLVKIIRWGLILVFDIAIILALRRLTPD